MLKNTPTAESNSVYNSSAGGWLFLSRLTGFGVVSRQNFLETLADSDGLLAMGEAGLKALGLRPEAREAVRAWQCRDTSHSLVRETGTIWRNVADHGIQLMTWADPDYPEALRHIHDAPLVLYLRGDRTLIGKEQLAIVGSRNASRAGLEHARSFAASLSQAGYLVTSGLALGVDGYAHAGALDAGCPTVAVIGSGLDRPYPTQHRALADRVIHHGLLVSEYPPGTPPLAGHFPRRNRIISGLSRGVLVVEASLRSGSLITARLAMEQGREVFAIPGSVHNPLARGCHDLIRQGARLVETLDDIREELGAWWSESHQAPKPPSPRAAASRSAPRQDTLALVDEPSGEVKGRAVWKQPGEGDLSPREIAVLQALGYDPLSTDDLCDATGMGADQLMQSLLLLELQGLVEASPGGYQKVV